MQIKMKGLNDALKMRITKKEILEKVQTLQYKNQSTTINDVYPQMLESIFDFVGGINIIGGRDLDYEGETDEHFVSGSAYYGTCIFTKKHGEIKHESKTDVYTRTCFEWNGQMIENVPPAIKYDNEKLEEIKNDPSYNLFYIVFSKYSVSTLKPFYAKNELDVRHRALSIWSRYDDIKTEKEVAILKEKYKDTFSRFYNIEENVYVLCDKN